MLSVVCCMSTMWILGRPSTASSTPPNSIPPFPSPALRPATQATTENVYGAYSGHIEFQQIVLVIKSFYCRVENSESSFDVKTGVRRKCPMSALLFNLAIDWVMRQTTSDRIWGIRWTLLSTLVLCPELVGDKKD